MYNIYIYTHVYIYICIYMYVYIYILVNYNDLTATEPWNHGFYREIIPFYGPTIQVSEIFLFTQIYRVISP